MRFFRPCFIAGLIYPEASFRIRTKEKLVCLTFDDGPDPASTPLLLDTLGRYNIKAHFFCCGNAVEKHPDLFQQIISDGHIAGNHSYSHPDGWQSSLNKYLIDVEKASELTSKRYFRPPYGKLRFKQYLRLKAQYRIIFWDIIPYDFDITYPEEKSLRILQNKIRPGSIIALHDRYRPSLYQYLNQFIENTLDSGYRFTLLDIS